MSAQSEFMVMGARLGFWYALGAVGFFAFIVVLGEIAKAMGGAA